MLLWPSGNNSQKTPAKQTVDNTVMSSETIATPLASTDHGAMCHRYAYEKQIKTANKVQCSASPLRLGSHCPYVVCTKGRTELPFLESHTTSRHSGVNIFQETLLTPLWVPSPPSNQVPFCLLVWLLAYSVSRAVLMLVGTLGGYFISLTHRSLWVVFEIYWGFQCHDIAVNSLLWSLHALDSIPFYSRVEVTLVWCWHCTCRVCQDTLAWVSLHPSNLLKSWQHFSTLYHISTTFSCDTESGITRLAPVHSSPKKAQEGATRHSAPRTGWAWKRQGVLLVCSLQPTRQPKLRAQTSPPGRFGGSQMPFRPGPAQSWSGLGSPPKCGHLEGLAGKVRGCSKAGPNDPCDCTQIARSMLNNTVYCSMWRQS